MLASGVEARAQPRRSRLREGAPTLCIRHLLIGHNRTNFKGVSMHLATAERVIPLASADQSVEEYLNRQSHDLLSEGEADLAAQPNATMPRVQATPTPTRYSCTKYGFMVFSTAVRS